MGYLLSLMLGIVNGLYLLIAWSHYGVPTEAEGWILAALLVFNTLMLSTPELWFRDNSRNITR